MLLLEIKLRQLQVSVSAGKMCYPRLPIRLHRKMVSTRRRSTYQFREGFNSSVNRIHCLPSEENERINHQEEEDNNHQLVIFDYLKGR